MVALVATMAVLGAGCDVTNPGPVQDEFLNDPTTHAGLVRGAERGLLIGSARISFAVATITREIFPGGDINSHSPRLQYGALPSEEMDEYWDPVQQARFIAEDALRRFADPDVTVDPVIQAQAYIWAGYANKLLGALPRYQRRGSEDRLAAYVAYYDAEIRYVDSAFGEIVTFLRETGRFDPSVVVFSSDHGESLGEHDLYFEHGWFAYEATLHVPLIVKLPGQSEGGEIARQVSNLDLLPTLMSLADVLPEADASGRDLFAEPGGSRTLVVQNSDGYPLKVHGVRTGGFKFLRWDDGKEELYDLNADPAEARNLIGELPERAAALRRNLDQSLRELRSPHDASRGSSVDKPVLVSIR